MNCRRFEFLADDWLRDRLEDDLVRRMQFHRDSCASCARFLQSEAHFLSLWKTDISSPGARDLWFRLSPQLEPARVRPATRVPRLAFGAAFLAVGAAFFMMQPLRTVDRPGPTGMSAGKTPATGAASAQSLVVMSSLSDVAKADPAIDDPAGTSMEEIWTHLNTANN